MFVSAEQNLDIDRAEIAVATWNLEWASIDTVRGRRIRSMLDDVDADILCLTETFPDMLPGDGRTVLADANYGYAVFDGRRKTALWSRFGWTDIDLKGVPGIPGGRFIAATSYTPVGPLRIVGVCIPWADAHVRTGRQDSRRWKEHLEYLKGLAEFLRTPHELPTIVLGDFNQRVPRKRQPVNVYNALTEALGSDLLIATAGVKATDGTLAIDHIAHSNNLHVQLGPMLAAFQDGMKLSDHFGIVAKISAKWGEVGAQI